MAKTAANKVAAADLDALERHLDSIQFEEGSVEERFYTAFCALSSGEMATALCKLMIRGHHVLDLEELAKG